jgi:hypothetical protein
MLRQRFFIYLKQRLGILLVGRFGLYFLASLVAIIGFTCLIVLIAERNAESQLKTPGVVFWWVMMSIIGVTDPGFFPVITFRKIMGIFLNNLDILFLGLLSALFVSAVVDFL